MFFCAGNARQTDLVSESIALVIQSEWLSWEGKTCRCCGTVEIVPSTDVHMARSDKNLEGSMFESAWHTGGMYA